MTWVFFIRLLAGCWSLAGTLDAISQDINEFRLGNTAAVSYVGGHATALQLKPSPTHLVGLATSQMSNP